MQAALEQVQAEKASAAAAEAERQELEEVPEEEVVGKTQQKASASPQPQGQHSTSSEAEPMMKEMEDSPEDLAEIPQGPLESKQALETIEDEDPLWLLKNDKDLNSSFLVD